MLELDARLGNSTIEPGEHTTLHIQVGNRGEDCSGDAFLRVRAPASLTLVSVVPHVRSHASRNELEFGLPAPLRDDSRDIAVEVYAHEAGDADICLFLECDGEQCERVVRCGVYGVAAFASHANRIEFFEREAAAGEDVRGRAILTNTGSATASIVALRAEGDLHDVAFGVAAPFTIERGARRIIDVSARLAPSAQDGSVQTLRAACVTESGEVSLGEACILARNHPRIEGTLEPVDYSDIAVAPGERVDWRLRLANAGGAPADFTLALHAAGSVYLTGSTRIQNARILDAGGISPLWSHDGMRIEGLQRGMELTLEFATVADAGPSTSILARVRCVGREALIESPARALIDDGKEPELPFRVGVALRSVAAPVLSAMVTASHMRRSGSAALEPAMASYLAGLDGLMRHLWALSVLCADTCDDPAVEMHLVVNRIALRSVFDRLAIKLRMPHYPVRGDDVLDPAAEDALDACGIPGGSLGARLAHATRLVAPQREEYAEFAGYRDALRTVLEGLGDDAAFIDALVAAQPVLDSHLDAVVERETGVRV